MIGETEMASNIVRWMKNKLNGYKQFSVMSPTELNDTRLSDMESLLRPSSIISDESIKYKLSGTCEDNNATSYKFEKTRHTNTQEAKLKFEELECDVSIDGTRGENANGQRQEFSFTLYDLDGHGKITKDDIAGLVKTIYEALGETIQVPRYGSKTIKVKLTVSPEKKITANNESKENTSPASQQQHEGRKNCQQDFQPISNNNNNNNNNNSQRWRRDRRERRYTKERRVRRRHSISSSGISEDREADVSNDEDEDEQSHIHNRLHEQSDIFTSPNVFPRHKKRSVSLQRQQLLEIIQANMEKNNLCFQSRKPHDMATSHHRHKTRHNYYDTPTHPNERIEMKDIDPHIRFPQRSRSNEKYKKQPTTHELKHRYRELEQARAKEQVVRWLEQEFSSPYKYSKRDEGKKRNNNLCNIHNDKRHHHIHEHVHHHYYYHQDPPVVV